MNVPNCPYCRSSYFENGNLTLAQRPSDGKFTIQCPSCNKLLPDYYMEKGELISEKKISDSNTQCYIATACYGDINSPEVTTFRKFRDRYLMSNHIGKTFVEYYYKYSPYLANKLKKHLLINKFVKNLLLNPICKLLRKDY